MNKRIKGFIFAAAILASLAGCAKGTDSQSDTTVETAVTTQDITTINTETVTESANAIVNDATEFQKYFLWIMAGQKIEYDLTISHKLTGIAKGVGVEFKKKR